MMRSVRSASMGLRLSSSSGTKRRRGAQCPLRSSRTCLMRAASGTNFSNCSRNKRLSSSIPASAMGNNSSTAMADGRASFASSARPLHAGEASASIMPPMRLVDAIGNPCAMPPWILLCVSIASIARVVISEYTSSTISRKTGSKRLRGCACAIHPVPTLPRGDAPRPPTHEMTAVAMPA